jgi:hypothetical protein
MTTTPMATTMLADDNYNYFDGDGATGIEVDDDGDGATGDDNDDEDYGDGNDDGDGDGAKMTRNSGGWHGTTCLEA